MHKCAICFGLLLSITIYVSGQQINFFEDDLASAIVEAQRDNKLIFVHGNASWCVPCRLMEEEVFIYPEVYSFFNEHFVNLSLDLEKGVGPIIAARYQANVLPYFMILTSDETLVHSFHGFQSINELLARAKESMSESKKMSAWEDRYEEGDRKPAFLYNYAFALYPSADGKHKEVVEAYLEANPNPLSEPGIRFAYHFVEQVDSELFLLMVDNRRAFYDILGSEKVARTIDLMVGQKIREESTTIEEGKQLILRAYPEDGPCRAIEYEQSRSIEDSQPATKELEIALRKAAVCGTTESELSDLGAQVLALDPPSSESVRQLDQLLRQHPQIRSKSDFLNLRGALQESIGNLGTAMDIYREGLDLAKSSKDKDMRKRFKVALKRTKKLSRRK